MRRPSRSKITALISRLLLFAFIGFRVFWKNPTKKPLDHQTFAFIFRGLTKFTTFDIFARFFPAFFRVRPYYEESTCSRPITEVQASSSPTNQPNLKGELILFYFLFICSVSLQAGYGSGQMC